jgi:hypothetical protein
MIRVFALALIVVCISLSKVFCQSTVGVLSTSSQRIEGYNIFYSHNQEKVLLIDNDGQVVHIWDDINDSRPGNSAYLLPNGNLVRAKRPNNWTEDPIWAPGGGASVDVVDWDSNILASYTLNNEQARLHHDIKPMPNGNVLMIAWEKISGTEAVAEGRDPALITQDHLLSEMILEWNPETNEIVWEWHVLDHLVQDKFANQANFGDVLQSRSKININYDEHDANPDWLHMNSIDYNPVLDQIAVSSPFFNEFWIIDHSTTKEEAKTAAGGNAGMGGEILFRFGNPKAYSSTNTNQYLYFQHNVHWLNPDAEAGEEDYGKMLVFNNQHPSGTSVGNLLQTLDPQTGAYLDPEVSADEIIIATYQHPDAPSIAYSTGVSSVQPLKDGNVLMFSGRFGYAYELNAAGEVVWEYRVPFKAGQPTAQGTVLGSNDNLTFRFNRIYPEDPALNGKTLTPMGLLEEFVYNPDNEVDEPDEEEVVTGIDNEFFETLGLKVYPNPFLEKLSFHPRAEAIGKVISIYNLVGNIVWQYKVVSDKAAEVNTLNWPQGFYILNVDGKTLKLLKQ